MTPEKPDLAQNEAVIEEDPMQSDTSQLLLPANKHNWYDLDEDTLEFIGEDPEYGQFDPATYCSLISKRFKESRAAKYDSNDDYWVHWSLALNKIWVKRCYDNPSCLRHRAALVYWWNRNECLKLWAKHRLSKQGRIRKLNKDAKRIRMIASDQHRPASDSKVAIKVTLDFNTIYEHHKSYFEREYRIEMGENAGSED